MRCSDGFYYVVTFQNNLQHRRILLNELLETKLAARMGLPTAPVALVRSARGGATCGGARRRTGQPYAVARVLLTGLSAGAVGTEFRNPYVLLSLRSR